MATNIFIRIGEIKGESRDSRHRDEIEVLSWAFGLTNPAGVSSGGVDVTGRASFHDITFTHLIDRSSPSLMLACASCASLKDARLTIRKTGTTTPQEFLVIVLQDVVVTGVECSGTEAAGGLVEQVSLNFARIDFEYKAQKPDGSLDDGAHFKWDLQSNSTF
jgi:type VI secretion system secreted protein Hcp